MGSASSHRRWAIIALVLAVLFRLPALINAGDVNSDAAVVGLQARHFAQGEWVWNLWGAQYQFAIEALMLAPFASVVGKWPVLVLMPPMVGMLLMIALVWRVLSRWMPPLAVFTCVLPLIFATHAIASPMVYVMRQMMVTCSVAGVALLHVAAKRQSAWLFFFGAVVFGTGAQIDAFGLIVYPAGAVLGAGLAWSAARGAWKRTLLWSFASLAGLALVFSQRRSLGNDPYSWEFYKWLWGERKGLLANTCLPFALGLKAYLPGTSAEWLHPAPMKPLVWFAVGLFVLLLLAPLGLFFVKRLDRHVRVLGLFGTVAALTAVWAFVLRAEDMWGVRYLAPVLWFAPFALAPTLALLGPRIALPMVGLWALVAGMAGWATWGSYVDGPKIVLTPHARLDEVHQLRDELLKRNVHAAFADYWQAYRLSLLFEEQIVVAPTNADRYPQYRAAASMQSPRAFLFEAGDPRAQPDGMRAQARATGTLVDDFTVGRYTVLLVR
ncbi:MAG: hypothetical protein JNM17_10275 [Archangium sp.]|nr:hypothetical protein [Archangium sp.]